MLTFTEMIQHPSQWLDASGPFSDIVYSSRIRLARNLKKIPFSHRANDDELRTVFLQAKEAAHETQLLKDALILDLGELDSLDRRVLAERHLISNQMVELYHNRGLVVTPGETLSVMINEEDHFRLQAITSGFNLNEAYEKVNQLDDELGSRLEYAFHDQWGYLTACPTNVGTGMRASVLIHLPGLFITREIDTLIKKIAKKGFVVRGLYGEGSDVKGNFFQISNQQTLGISELETLERLEKYTRELIEQEKAARDRVFQEAKNEIEDKIWRAYGTLKYAHILNSDNMMNLCSLVRLGISSNWIKETDTSRLNELLVFAQPAHLQRLQGQPLNVDERDVIRAKLVRENLDREN
ncbi:MAG: protein arginine kinase [Gemmatimonadetes bacterium]|nr:MAG: protein arginine kinase [Gemmatimonadota bacterium]